MKKLKLLLICSILCFSITGCGKSEEDETTSEKHAYATNDTFDKTTTEYVEEPKPYIVDNTTEESTTEKKNVIGYGSTKDKVLQFNVDEDANAKNEKLQNTKNGTLSIDGKLLTIPCTYQTLKDTFGKIYIEIPDDGSYEVTNPKEYKDLTHAELTIKPEGVEVGIITFTLESEQPTTLDQMTCNKVELHGYTFTDKKLFTCSIQDDIHLGSEVDKVKESLGDDYEANLDHQKNDIGYYEFTYSGKNDNGDKYQLDVSFRNSKLFYISLQIQPKK